MQIVKSAPVTRSKTVTETISPGSVDLHLSIEDAQKLRRMCYYNKTVSKKFKGNNYGGARKADDLNAFMVSLGNGLKNKGIERY